MSEKKAFGRGRKRGMSFKPSGGRNRRPDRTSLKARANVETIQTTQDEIYDNRQHRSEIVRAENKALRQRLRETIQDHEDVYESLSSKVERNRTYIQTLLDQQAALFAASARALATAGGGGGARRGAAGAADHQQRRLPGRRGGSHVRLRPGLRLL